MKTKAYGTEGWDELLELIKGKECARCDGLLNVGYAGKEGDRDVFRVKCNCTDQEPVLRNQISAISRRYHGIMKNALARQEGEKALSTIQELKALVCPRATDAEAGFFMKFCEATGLSPFLREVYLIKYGDKAEIVIGVDAFLKRAAGNPNYKGYQAGVIVVPKDSNTPVEREGELVLSGESLVGGWCLVHRTDWAKPLKATVNFAEYDKGQATWKEKPATMIVVRAIGQGHRRAFPRETEILHQAAGDLEVTVSNVEEEAREQELPILEADHEVKSRVIDVEGRQVDEGTGEIIDESGPMPSDEALKDAAEMVQRTVDETKGASVVSGSTPKPGYDIDAITNTGMLFQWAYNVYGKPSGAVMPLLNIKNASEIKDPKAKAYELKALLGDPPA